MGKLGQGEGRPWIVNTYLLHDRRIYSVKYKAFTSLIGFILVLHKI